MGQTSKILRLFLQHCDFEESSSGILKRVHLSPFDVPSAFLGHKNHEARLIYFFKREAEIWLSIYRILRPMAVRWHEIPWDLWYVSFRAGKAVKNPIDCQTGKRYMGTWKEQDLLGKTGLFLSKTFCYGYACKCNKQQRKCRFSEMSSASVTVFCLKDTT